MNLSTISSLATLPLRLVGRIVEAVGARATGKSPSGPATPPTDVPVAEDVPTPPRPTPPRPAAAPSAGPTRSAASTPSPTPAPVEPIPTPVTDIDAAAEAEEVDVTPTDVAKAMGTQLDPGGTGTS